ncbi:carboxymuconolactone decarboxylase family protein [Kribbella sp. NPDC050459]|uniref:carboxymuconolactone decarboxylase family protein n=1 Tax=Kribbella sp. NPDC050459 TaxID=3155785 RepID=UPI0033C67AC9
MPLLPDRAYCPIMAERIQVIPEAPEAYELLLALNRSADRAATDAGVEKQLVELVKIRTSMLNGCVFCVDMHTHAARHLGETDRRIDLLAVWREADLYTGRERAALALAEALTRLCRTQEVPDDVYDQALAVLTPEQYGAIVWIVTVYNAFNRLSVCSRTPLPPTPTEV